MRNFGWCLLAAALVATACSSGQTATFAVTGASVDPTYTCPRGADNAAYDLHATIDVHNGTSAAVTVKTVTAELKLVAFKGGWLEKFGDKYEAADVKFAPTSIGAGATTAVNATIPSACTNGKSGPGQPAYGEYNVTMHLATSNGAFTVSSKNRHRIVAG